MTDTVSSINSSNMDNTTRSGGNNGAMDVLLSLDILNKVAAANSSLEIIMKGLFDYIEMKRLTFPRFYFVSNWELMNLISDCNADPTKIRNYVQSLFPGIFVAKVSYTYYEVSYRVFIYTLVTNNKVDTNIHIYM